VKIRGHRAGESGDPAPTLRARRLALAARWLVPAAAALVPVHVSAAGAPEPVDVAAVISGGVSLGAYQAGGTWADLEALRARGDAARLAVVTGASAGNINAFLAAIYWCDAESPAGRVDRSLFANPFFDVWVNIGWEKLSPKSMDGRTYAGLFADPLGSTTFRSVSNGIARDGGGAPWFTAETPFTAEDGLFTRSAFAAAEAYLARRLVEARVARGTCEVAVGVTVTREAAADYPVETVSAQMLPADARPPDDRGLRVPTQRYVVPLRLVVDTDGGHLRNALGPDGSAWWSNASHRRIAKALHLPVPAEGPPDVPPADVLRLVKASSAFPVVFAPIRLPVCFAGGELGGAAPAAHGLCPPGTSGASERFADGGFFDNVPLGLALELVADRPAATRASTVEYVYVDPENRRVPPSLAPRAERRQGLDLAVATLGDVISEARTFELQGLARYARTEIECRPPSLCPDGPRHFRASSRFHRIVGAYLVHNFAAFTHQVFRVHDYLVGVYDAVFVDAGGQQLEDTAEGIAALTAGFAARLRALRLDAEPQPLAPHGIHRADELLWRLFREEVAARTRTSTRAAVCAAPGAPAEVCGPDAAWRTDDRCLSRPAATCRDPVLLVHETLAGLAGSGDDFDGFVTAYGTRLAAAGRSLPATPGDAPSSELAWDAVGPPGSHRDWTRAQHMRFLERAVAVEAHDAEVWAQMSRAPEAEDRAVLGLKTDALGKLGLRVTPLVDPKPQERLDLDPSTVDAYVRDDAGPGRTAAGLLFHALPYALGWDARRLGPVAGWEPRFDLVGADVTPRLRYELGLDRQVAPATLLHRLGLGVGYDAWVGGTGMVTVAREGGGLTGLGLALSADFLRSLRFTVGLDRLLTLPEGDLGARALYFSWSLLDVNGGLAWLALSP
jgi:predicted acylesterase/phospholipase RssA